MAAFSYMTFFLISSTLAHTVFSGIIKSHDINKWPKPHCKMYISLDPAYPSSCPDVTAYVCAANGHTYQNECFFCLDQWEFGRDIEFHKFGKCF